MLKKLCLIILAICVSTLFVSCEGAADAGTGNSNSNTQYGIKDDVMDKGPEKGGTLNILSTQPDTFNPLLTNNAYVRDFLGFIFESLITIDRNQRVTYSLASSYEFSEGGFTLTIKLKDKIFWHDNMPISSEDVEFTVNTIKRADLRSPYRKNVENIEACEVVDDRTIRFKLYNSNYFAINFMTFPIIAKHHFLDEDMTNMTSDSNMKPVGTGPYKFVSYKDNEIRLMVNTKWRETAPYISEVCIKLYDNINDAVNAFNRHEADTAYIEPGFDSAYSGRTDISVKKYVSRNYEFLAFNMQKPALAEKAVRQAIASALDRYRLINEAIPGEAVAADFPLLPESWLTDARNNAVPSDISKARELLLQNNWREYRRTDRTEFYKYVNDVYTPLNLELLVNDDNEQRGRVAQKIADQLREAGINITVKTVKWEDELKLINLRNFDIVLIGNTISSVPDLSYMYGTGNKSGQSSGAWNIAGYSNQKVDEMLQGALRTNVSQDQKYFIDFARSIINDEVPYIGLYFKYESGLFSKKIRGVINPYTWDRYYDFTKWYIPQA